MDEIKEPELIDATKNEAVEFLIIKQTDEGYYQLILKLSWKKQNSILVTSRGEIKEWVSYERMVERIKKYYSNIPIVNVEMNYEYFNKTIRILPNIKNIAYDEKFTNT